MQCSRGTRIAVRHRRRGDSEAKGRTRLRSAAPRLASPERFAAPACTQGTEWRKERGAWAGRCYLIDPRGEGTFRDGPARRSHSSREGRPAGSTRIVPPYWFGSVQPTMAGRNANQTSASRRSNVDSIQRRFDATRKLAVVRGGVDSPRADVAQNSARAG